MAKVLFYTEKEGLVIVCPEIDPDNTEVGEVFWPVLQGGAFCGVTYDELRSVGKGTLEIDDRGAARIRE